jgi:hypothetical protein
MLGVRWTIGDVNLRGFQALHLSVWGAWRLFGNGARYRIYVNSVGLARAAALTGPLPAAVEWSPAAVPDLPDWLAGRLDGGLAEGVAWKFAPMRAFPDDHELAVDNDVILWRRPPALDAWLGGATPFLLAADVRRCFGVFDDLCPGHGVNSGIRGLPPAFDLAAGLRALLALRPVRLEREVDEQGLQVAALLHAGPVGYVGLDEVTICSPFPPHTPYLGRSGAHFVGLNTRHLGFEFEGRPAEEVRAAHWDACLPDVFRRVGMAESARG